MKLCECGCGLPAPIATRNRKRGGWIKGEPLRFAQGHSAKAPHYNDLRDALERNYQKLGESECWPWLGHIQPTGYGVVRYKGKAYFAHRLSYAFVNGDISPDIQVCHTCDNRRCVNPNHLFLGTAAENSADMVSKQRQARGDHHGMSKLTAKEVAEMRLLYSSGVSQRTLARQFGVTKATVKFVVNRVTWKHVEDRNA